MKHRSDIDGLRAVAVLPVVAYHAGLRFFPGGFVGVDVFFVISGYLICSLIARDLETGSFSIGEFYVRRIFRILPAFVAVLSVTAAAAWLYMLPSEFETFARSLLMAVASISNVFFSHQSGYFDAPAETAPMLHTWSLAVEEQFYLVFPILMVLLKRGSAARGKHVLMGLALLSFLAALGASRWAPTQGFYLAPFRAWELLLGALVALGAFPAPGSAAARSWLTMLGLAAILGSGFLASARTPLPLAITPPCLGAALIILSGEKGSSPVGAWLAWRPLAFIGLISYSVYLWHWPLLVFQHSNSVFLAQSSTYFSKFVMIAISLAVGAASWRWIETPARRWGARNASGARTVAFGGAAVALGSLAAFALTIISLDGVTSRFPPRAVALGAYLDYRPERAYREGECFVRDFADFNTAKCLRALEDKPNDLLIGDSHAAHLWYGLDQVATDVNVMQATAMGCKPVVTPATPFDAPGCSQLMRTVFDDYLATHKVDKLLIAAQWKDKDLPKIAATLDWAAERHIAVVLFGPIVQYDYSLPRLLADSLRWGNSALADDRRIGSDKVVDAAMRELAKRKGAEFISFYDTLCQGRTCVTLVDGSTPLQFDYGHLTSAGSVLVARIWSSSGAFP